MSAFFVVWPIHTAQLSRRRCAPALACLSPKALHACACRCLCAAISQFYPGKWPATRPVILVCVIVYLIISAVTAIFQWKIEGNAFLHTKRTKVDCCPAQSELALANVLNDTVLLYKHTHSNALPAPPVTAYAGLLPLPDKPAMHCTCICLFF